MAQLTNEAVNTLKNSTVNGNIVKLPNGTLDRKIYLEVKKRLELIGGKWKGGNVKGFLFNENPSELLEQIANGEKRNLKKEFQFFGTPSKLADLLVSYADINNSHKILEPSAGQGAIVKSIHKVCPTVPVDYCEIMGINQTFLDKISNVNMVGSDFLCTNLNGYYDRVIANPPFSKNQDIEHIYKMYDCLKLGGRLVSIASKHWQLSNNKTETKFREWLGLVKADIHEVKAGEFKESGTSIATVIIVINK